VVSWSVPWYGVVSVLSSDQIGYFDSIRCTRMFSSFVMLYIFAVRSVCVSARKRDISCQGLADLYKNFGCSKTIMSSM
jgi:hypothetical protein